MRSLYTVGSSWRSTSLTRAEPRRIFDRRLLVVDDDADLWPILARIGRLLDRDLRVDFASDSRPRWTSDE